MSQMGCKLAHHFLHPTSEAFKDKLCGGSAGSDLSLETSDVTLVWDDGKRVEAHKEVEEVLGVVGLLGLTCSTMIYIWLNCGLRWEALSETRWWLEN